jgi:NAD(P)H-dependent FMN reductase
VRIIGLSGSLRAASFNTALLRAATVLVPAGASFTLETIAGIPVYDGDLEERQGLPEPVVRLKEAIATSDGLIIATPEYNGSIPGPIKNAIDWLSRPPKDIPRVFGRRPVALIGATPGGRGTWLAQTAWLPVFRELGARPWFGGTLTVSGATKRFDEAGQLSDEETRERLRKFLDGFVQFARSGQG